MTAVTPEPIIKVAMGFMAAKHLFVASEVPFVQDHPVTVGIEPNSKALVLLDGYHRAVRLWRKSDVGTTLMAYVPTDLAPPILVAQPPGD